MNAKASRPKLILINGFAAAGKSTIAKLYVTHHPLAMVIEGDELIVHIGNWQEHESEARQHVFMLTKMMAKTYLHTGNDVILPYLLLNENHSKQFKAIANNCGADYYELYLHETRSNAISKLQKRGSWGEQGQPPITKAELPIIESMYEDTQKAVQKRPNSIRISTKGKSFQQTYIEMLQALATDTG